MTKAQYPQNPQFNISHSLSTHLQDFSNAFNKWTEARETSLQSQIELLKSCKNDAEVKRYKEMGLLTF